MPPRNIPGHPVSTLPLKPRRAFGGGFWPSKTFRVRIRLAEGNDPAGIRGIWPDARPDRSSLKSVFIPVNPWFILVSLFPTADFKLKCHRISVLEKTFPASEHGFPESESPHPMWEARIVISEKLLPTSDFAFPTWGFGFPISERPIPISEMVSPTSEILFPTSLCRFPTWGGAFPASEKAFPGRLSFSSGQLQSSLARLTTAAGRLAWPVNLGLPAVAGAAAGCPELKPTTEGRQ